MGYKTRDHYTTGGFCLRECVNKENCGSCYRFSNWVLPKICTISSLKVRAEEAKDWRAWNRAMYLIDKHGLWQKVETESTWKLLTEDGDDKGDKVPKVQKGRNSRKTNRNRV
jgi:hypothetical protein